MQWVCQIESRPHLRVGPPQLDHQPRYSGRPEDCETRLGLVKISSAEPAKIDSGPLALVDHTLPVPLH